MYQDIYSVLYEWSLKRWHGDDYMASFLTACTLAGAVGMNIVLGIGVFVAAYGPIVFLQEWVWIIIIALLFWLNYSAFIRHDRYKKVVERFRDRPSGARRRLAILAWGYLLASYGLPIVFGFIMLTVNPT